MIPSTCTQMHPATLRRQFYPKSKRRAVFPLLSTRKHLMKHKCDNLQGRKFKIFTDSKILYYLREAKESNPKLMRWSLLLQDYDFDITHISGKSNKIADILSRVSHNQEEDVSRRIHTAKKEILQKIRDQVEEMDIPNGMTLSMSEMNTMVVANTSHQHQAGALLQHHFHRLHDPMFATAAKTKPKLNVFINSLEDVQEHEDNHMNENHHYTSWELLLAATSFQAGNMSLPDFRKLQEQDEYCTKIKRLAETDQIAKHFHVRQGILIRIFSPGKDDPERRKIRPPTIVLPAVLVDMIIDAEHQGPLGAHLAPKRVFLSLRERYHFPSMESRVSQRIKQCLPCQLNMYTTTKNHKHSTGLSSGQRPQSHNHLCRLCLQLCDDKTPANEDI